MSNELLNQHITEDRLQAWLDHELGRRESALVSEHVRRCVPCAELLNECQHMRATVSHLLNSFDGELHAIPRAERSARAKSAFSSRTSSAPMINHIVAFNQPVECWPATRRIFSMAALAMIFVGTATTVMVRGYHSVAGSVTTFANSGPGVTSAKARTGALPSATRRVSLRGMVTSPSGKGISGTQVSIRGTDLKTVTDFAGHFLFRGVPQSATALDAKGPPGYDSHAQYVNLYESAEPVVNIVLLSTALSLRPYVITSEFPAPGSAAHSQLCLSSFEPYTARDPRMFQGLQGQVLAPGDFRMTVVDWPNPGRNSSALFTMEPDGTLLGRVRQGDADIRITLTRDGSVWRGSASETRNYNSRWHRVSMRESSCTL